MTAREIIEVVLTECKLSPTELADVVGINRTQIYDLRRGATNRLSKKVANAINKQFPKYSLYWLLTGNEDQQIIHETTNVNIDRSTGKSGGDMLSGGVINVDLVEQLQDRIKQLERQVETQNQIILNLTSNGRK